MHECEWWGCKRRDANIGLGIVVRIDKKILRRERQEIWRGLVIHWWLVYYYIHLSVQSGLRNGMFGPNC